MITNLSAMMVERLKLFKVRSKNLPQRILVYRDGVSEVCTISRNTNDMLMFYQQGQFAIVVGEELPAIKAAFKQFSTPQAAYNPKLTIVICGKRHHTRFYPTEASAADRDGNPRPGTVVDRGVTAVYDFDFFLQGVVFHP
jgi:eukaryotic translation initiation factor 2C